VAWDGEKARQEILYEEYSPYGSTSYRTSKSGVEVSARRHRYTGKERDEETGLYYHGARYYAAWLGRWTSTDPLALQAGVNLYLYCRAGPVTYVDPDGLEDAKALRITDQPGAGVSDEFDPGGGGAGGAPGNAPRRFAQAPALDAQDVKDLEDPFSEPNMLSTGGGGGDSGDEVYEQLTDWQLFQVEETSAVALLPRRRLLRESLARIPNCCCRAPLSTFSGRSATWTRRIRRRAIPRGSRRRSGSSTTN